MNLIKKNKPITLLSYLTLLTLSLIIILFHEKDIDLSNSWLIFYLWLINFCLAILFIAIKIPKNVYNKLISIIAEDRKIIFLIFLITLFARFFLLSVYPYVVLGDPLRDAGLNGLKINQGSLKDFFGFGAYQGYGNFIPLISYFFIPLFKNSPLIYLIPSAIVGILSVLVTYLLGRIWGGRKVAIIASLFLVASPFHLHYSRTELLAIMDSLLSPLIILSIYSALIFFQGYFLAGLISGFAFHFYAGIRGVLFISVFYLFLIRFTHLISFLIKKDIKGLYLNFKNMILGLVIFSIGLIIALGPTINRINLNKDNNLVSNVGTTKIIFSDDQFIKKNLLEKVNYLYKSYEKSFLVYIFNSNTDFHFYYDSPLVNFPLNWLFLIGLFYLLVKRESNKKQLTNLLIFIIFLFPFTNQVIINSIGASHRLMSILPVLSIFSAYGMIMFFEKLTGKYSSVIIGIIIFSYLVWQLSFYFIDRPSDRGFDELGIKEYVFQNIVEYIKKDRFYDAYFILNDNQFNYDTLHHREKIEFFTQPKKVELVDKDAFLTKLSQESVLKNKKTAFIFLKPIPEIEHYEKIAYETLCSKRILPNYNCPNNFFGGYHFYILIP